MTQIYIFSVPSCQWALHWEQTLPLPSFGLTKKVTILLIFRPLWQQIRFEFQYSLASFPPDLKRTERYRFSKAFITVNLSYFFPQLFRTIYGPVDFSVCYKMPHTSQLSPKRAVLKFLGIKVGWLFEVSWHDLSSHHLLYSSFICKNLNDGTFCLQLEESLNEPLWLLTPEIGISWVIKTQSQECWHKTLGPQIWLKHNWVTVLLWIVTPSPGWAGAPCSLPPDMVTSQDPVRAGNTRGNIGVNTSLRGPQWPIIFQ